MHWITEISLNNYRAFKRQYKPIKIPFENHILIYGENGSGKSSIFNAVKDFFQSSVNLAQGVEVNYFEQLAGNNIGNIQLKITEMNAAGVLQNPIQYTFAEPIAGSNHRIQQIQLANKLKGFLDYKKMLKTHFLESKAGQNPNLFNLIVEELLSDHLINSVQGGVANVELQQEWNKLKYNILKLDGRYTDHKDSVRDLPLFERSLRTLLINVFAEFKRLIQAYFDSKLDIDIVLQLSYNANSGNLTRSIYLDIKYAGQAIASYHTFLNEARLSAMALCIYLAALKTYPQASDLKILYLDDVFIGLDTNNRIPLLKILQNEFIIAGYQIFISTYDRQWFETARNWFINEKCKFIHIELYVEDDGNPLIPDAPIIIDPSEDYFQKAKKYFKAKDYPTAANHLRKACENELKRILPENLRLVAKDKGVVSEIDKLETLVNNFDSYIQKNSINSVPFRHIKTYKKIILNPLSHDDLEAPHYKSEIQDGINLVENLKKIQTKEILKTVDSYKKPMKLGMIDGVSGSNHDYEITVLENLQIIKDDANPAKLSIVECEILLNGIKRKFNSLDLALDQIWNETNQAGAINYPQLYNSTMISINNGLSSIMIL